MHPTEFKKILIIATRQIGDTLITTPLIKRAHEIWPEAKIDFLGFKNAVGILEGNPYLHEVIGVNPKPRFKEYVGLIKTIYQAYDLAIMTQPSDRAYFYGFLAAHQRIGVYHPGQEDQGWKKWITRSQVPINYFEQHVVTEKLRLLDPFIPVNHLARVEQQDSRALKTTLKSISVDISIDTPQEVPLPLICREIAPFSVLLHPSPLTAYKKWPLAHWQGLIEYLTSQNIPVLISGGKSLVDETLASEILAGLSKNAQSQTMNLTGEVSFSELAAILRKVRAYVGVDTSVTHLAAACDTPTIALFGATPPTNFGPWPNGFKGSQPYLLQALMQTVENVTILQGPNPCVPCRKAGCDDRPDSRSLCLEELTLERVIMRIQELLDSKSTVKAT